MNDTKTCESCKHCYSKTDGAGFVMYLCKINPRIVVGESNYLDGTHFAKACEDYERSTT